MGQAGVPLERSLTMTADAGRGRYARSMEYFDDRRRAESFGEVASDYDAYRPRYPAALIAAIMQAAEAAAETRTQTSSDAATEPGTGTDADPGTVTGTDPDARVPRILDVGSGTGSLASQLRESGAKLLTLQPYAVTGAVAREIGLEVEVSSFERSDRRGGTAYLFSFGHSYQWVDPIIALPGIHTPLDT